MYIYIHVSILLSLLANYIFCERVKAVSWQNKVSKQVVYTVILSDTASCSKLSTFLKVVIQYSIFLCKIQICDQGTWSCVSIQERHPAHKCAIHATG